MNRGIISSCRNMSDKVVFRQLFEKESSTYTYILGCKRTKQAIIIDPVDVTVERDAKLLKELGFKLAKAVNTHVHADHVTGTHLLRSHFQDLKTGLGSANVAKSDEKFGHSHQIEIGDISLEVRHTPGGCAVLTFPRLCRAHKRMRNLSTTKAELPLRATLYSFEDAAALIFKKAVQRRSTSQSTPRFSLCLSISQFTQRTTTEETLPVPCRKKNSLIHA